MVVVVVEVVVFSPEVVVVEVVVVVVVAISKATACPPAASSSSAKSSAKESTTGDLSELLVQASGIEQLVTLSQELGTLASVFSLNVILTFSGCKPDHMACG